MSLPPPPFELAFDPNALLVGQTVLPHQRVSFPFVLHLPRSAAAQASAAYAAGAAAGSGNGTEGAFSPAVSSTLSALFELGYSVVAARAGGGSAEGAGADGGLASSGARGSTGDACDDTASGSGGGGSGAAATTTTFQASLPLTVADAVPSPTAFALRMELAACGGNGGGGGDASGEAAGGGGVVGGGGHISVGAVVRFAVCLAACTPAGGAGDGRLPPLLQYEVRCNPAHWLVAGHQRRSIRPQAAQAGGGGGGGSGGRGPAAQHEFTCELVPLQAGHLPFPQIALYLPAAAAGAGGGAVLFRRVPQAVVAEHQAARRVQVHPAVSGVRCLGMELC